MHELPVTQSVLQVALEAAQDNGAHRITAINLVIGDLSSIVDDSIQFYFDILSRDTLAEGASLRFQRLPGQVTCWDCSTDFEASLPLKAACPQCGSGKLRVSGGNEFYVASIEVDDDTDYRS